MDATTNYNQVGFLRKPDESVGFAEIVDFLRGSNLRYALTTNPTIYDSLIKQFWQSATANTKADGSLEINATIDTIGYTITEASIRDSLQLDDAAGITMLPNDELFGGMGQMGSKSGGWDQFGSNIATALICLSTNRVYNFSKLIFDGMVANLKSKKKFLMYPRVYDQGDNQYLYWPSMLLVATNPIAGQEHEVVAPSQPSSSTPPAPSTSSPLAVTAPTPIPVTAPILIPITTPPPIHTSTPTPPPILTPYTYTTRLVTPPTTKSHASGEEQVEDMSPNTLEAAPKTLSKVVIFKRQGTLSNWHEQVMYCGAEKIYFFSCLKGQTEGQAPDDQKKKKSYKFSFEAPALVQLKTLDLIRAKLEANAELSKNMLGSELQGEDFAKKMVDLVNQRKKYFAEEKARAKETSP
ncbi:hypothetical protein Tco_1121323 [Tanacetum coccineum]|uniref:Xylulose kinase-1 n=1 Tax=Tanacetum coccineum TaxID=301880 RepID=A0ABQ5J0B0_9ASTR